MAPAVRGAVAAPRESCSGAVFAWFCFLVKMGKKAKPRVTNLAGLSERDGNVRVCVPHREFFHLKQFILQTCGV